LNLIELRLAQGSVERPSKGLPCRWFHSPLTAPKEATMKRLDLPALDSLRSAFGISRRNSAAPLVLIGLGAIPFIANAQTSQLPGVLVQGKVEAALPMRPVSALSSMLGDDWLTQPVSSTVLNERLIRESGSQRLADVLRFDASVDANYSPLGYTENFQVRGFPVDPIFGYRVNGVPVVGESPLALDNKRGVEVVRGPSGAWAGIGTSAGLINLLTKRPDDVREAGLRVWSRNSVGSTLDWGERSASGGWRVNASLDQLRPDARGANGKSQLLALAIDRVLTPTSLLEVDVEVQRREQITQPGSQLLGGKVLPPITPDTVLGLSSWSRPTTFASTFAMARLDQRLDSGWKLTSTASIHRVETDDRSSFPYGCSAAFGTAAGAYFCPDGGFTLYDFRSLNESRQTVFAEVRGAREVQLSGLRHAVGLGVSLTQRQTRMPDYVFDATDQGFVDTGNAISRTWFGGPSNATGTSVFDSRIRQTSAVLSDRVDLSQDWSLAGQARWVQYEDVSESHFYGPTSLHSSASNNRVIPSVALQRRLTPQAVTYLSYREDLAAGQRAPLGAANNGEVLPARRMQSVEAGARLILDVQSSASLAVFRGRRPYDFRDDQGLDQAPGSFVQRGTESRLGLELGATHVFTPRLEGQVSATLMHSSTDGTGNPLFEGREAVNTPKFRSSAFLMCRVPGAESLRLNGAWLYTGRRPAARDNSVYAPAFHRVDLGASWVPRWGAQSWTYRLTIENVFDRRYWRDVGEFLGDAYLTPGASRSVRASATWAF
jgi:iron complex outermembrane receptor protein